MYEVCANIFRVLEAWDMYTAYSENGSHLGFLTPHDLLPVNSQLCALQELDINCFCICYTVNFCISC